MNTYQLTEAQLNTIMAAVLETATDAEDSREQGKLNPEITAGSYRKLLAARVVLRNIILNQTDYAEPLTA
jgi:hypothetical protein